jgi:hypothetical protein
MSEYDFCGRCGQWVKMVEKLHCWICPKCRLILKYKEEKGYGYCNEVALSSYTLDTGDLDGILIAWECQNEIECHKIFYTKMKDESDGD